MAGAELIGKTSCEYFCLSGGSHTGHSGPNPHRRGYSAGGSSSGSAVAVAAGAVDMALGADQAGSIRVPASYCGLTGLKPTHGLVPYTGIAPLDPVLDHVGPMTATVADSALLLDVIAGVDGYDPRQQQPRVGQYQDALDTGLDGLRVGVLTEGLGQDGGEPDVDTAVRHAAVDLGKLGADVIDVSVPMHSVGAALWMPIIMHGMARTVVDGQGFGIGRDDRYPTDMMNHLFAGRARVDELPANIKLCGLMAQFVADRHGQLYYGKAINGIRRLRAAYDTALRRLAAHAHHAAEGAAPTHRGRIHHPTVRPSHRDVRKHRPLRCHPPPGAQPALRQQQRTPHRPDARRTPLRREQYLPRRLRLRTAHHE